MSGIINMNNTGLKMPGFLDKKSKLIEHQFNGPFIPLANPPKILKKLKVIIPKLICKRNHKVLKKHGITKGQEVIVSIAALQIIKWYDEKNKINCTMSLARKIYNKCFKEVK